MASAKEAGADDVQNWHSVAMMSWSLGDCAICSRHISDLCIRCQEKRKLNQTSVNSPCTMVKGVCLHTFHWHCISRWLQTRKDCPLDNSIWEVQKGT